MSSSKSRATSKTQDKVWSSQIPPKYLSLDQAVTTKSVRKKLVTVLPDILGLGWSLYFYSHKYACVCQSRPCCSPSLQPGSDFHTSQRHTKSSHGRLR